ncbi:hypothetical protein [Gordonia alkanivorans]|uniref:hypothetical protein n=1 Tax=Gordonia alkanivorans TaxID=84096 RepID=UPI0004BC546E|nr:hypothetical protein [Gordonia alkanivorans]
MTTNAECELHGLSLTGAYVCALCVRQPGVCDFGGCIRPATLHATQYQDGVRMETREICDGCIDFARSLHYEVTAHHPTSSNPAA